MPELSDDAVAELRKLRAEMHAINSEVAKFRALHRTTVVRHGWLKHVIKGLETDPHVQYKVHFYGVIYWLLNFPLVAGLFFFEPALWLKLGIFITLIYSIYANFATDYGSMSAAMAAFGQTPLPEIITETHVEAPK
jgi:hypothetical protein